MSGIGTFHSSNRQLPADDQVTEVKSENVSKKMWGFPISRGDYTYSDNQECLRNDKSDLTHHDQFGMLEFPNARLRQSCETYFRKVLGDAFWALSYLCSCQTLKVAIYSAIIGPLLPIAFIGAMQTGSLDEGKLSMGQTAFSFLLWGGILALPFAIVYAVAPQSSGPTAILICMTIFIIILVPAFRLIRTSCPHLCHFLRVFFPPPFHLIPLYAAVFRV